MSESQDLGVMNFQIQYFPRWAKEALDSIAAKNGITKKDLLVIIAANAEEIESFLKKQKKLITKA